jgi:hypothetical protein
MADTRRIDQDETGRRLTHDQWAVHVPRTAWHPDQCLFCRFYLPVEGPLGDDWGACANPASPRNATVTFEHDHCDAFVRNEGFNE